jgi:copper chaperone CopZ
MKTITSLFIVILLTSFSAVLQAQSTPVKKEQVKTATFKVLGNCDMCKARIEKAVKDDGASAATWDKKSKMLTVTFDPSKTNTDKLEKKLASVGHDTEKYKADDETYNALPACCKYDRDK